jgi:hypothetical protein
MPTSSQPPIAEATPATDQVVGGSASEFSPVVSAVALGKRKAASHVRPSKARVVKPRKTVQESSAFSTPAIEALIAAQVLGSATTEIDLTAVAESPDEATVEARDQEEEVPVEEQVNTHEEVDEVADLATRVAALKELVAAQKLSKIAELRDQVTLLSNQILVSPSTSVIRVVPNSQGVYPPSTIRDVVVSMVKLAKKYPGHYCPPACHVLAAIRLYPSLKAEFEDAPPMSFVQHIGEAIDLRFQTYPGLMMALFSGRLGSRGASVLCFKA